MAFIGIGGPGQMGLVLLAFVPAKRGYLPDRLFECEKHMRIVEES